MIQNVLVEHNTESKEIIIDNSSQIKYTLLVEENEGAASTIVFESTITDVHQILIEDTDESPIDIVITVGFFDGEVNLPVPDSNGLILAGDTDSSLYWVDQYTHPSFTPVSIDALTGQVIDTLTSNTAGHITGASLRYLLAADIPNLAISKITGLQTALDDLETDLTDHFVADNHSQYALLDGRDGDVLLIDNLLEFNANAGITAEGVLIKDNFISNSYISVASINTPTYDNVKDWIDTTQSAGHLGGGTITDDGDGTITVSAGQGVIKTTNSAIGENVFFDWGETNLSPDDGVTSYVYINYTLGTPVVLISTSNLSNGHTIFNLGRVFREGNDIHILNAGQQVQDATYRIQSRINSVGGTITRSSGLIISEIGTRNLAMTAGIIWRGFTKVNLSNIDTSDTDTFEYYYLLNGTWTESDQTQIDNVQYNDVSTPGSEVLANVSLNNFGVHWVYMDVDGHMLVVYGQDNYAKLSDAEDATPPSIGWGHIADMSVIIGKVILKRNATSFDAIYSAFEVLFSSSVITNHNYLAGLQGGTADEYYHLTSAQHTIAIQAASDTLSGYLTSTDWNTFNDKVSFDWDYDWNDLINTPTIPDALSDLSDVVSATNTDKFALMANGTTGYVGRALVEADISDLGSYVGLTGNESVDGIKTFTSFGITPSSAPTTDYQWANKKYVDDAITTPMVYPDAGIAVSTGSAWGTSIVDNSANWDTAYLHSQDSTQAHSDYLLNNANDTTTGNLTANSFINIFAALTDGVTVSWDCNTGLSKTLTTSRSSFTLDITNMSNGMYGELHVYTTTNCTVTIPSGYSIQRNNSDYPVIQDISLTFNASVINNTIGFVLKWRYDGTRFIYSGYHISYDSGV